MEDRSPAPDQARERFDRQIAPLLASQCLNCHRGAASEGGLDLSTRSSALRGGESGAAIRPGNRSGSLLWRRIRAGEMPPKSKLPARDIERIGAWIEDGATWGADPIDVSRLTTGTRAGSDWWSLQPLRSVAPPPAPPEHRPRIRSPIDAFVHAKLHSSDLLFSPDAEPRELVCRLHIDLIGLLPDPAVVEKFCADPTERAYEQLVDRLLSSPGYGERWGRHWLDLARFGESDGFERNSPRQHLWPYRDWVIDALNQDMTYDEFARRQIAGDVMGEGDRDGLAAAAFLVAGVHNTVVGKSERMRRGSSARRAGGGSGCDWPNVSGVDGELCSMS